MSDVDLKYKSTTACNYSPHICYRCEVEAILTSCVTVWYGNCSGTDRKALQRVVKTAEKIMGCSLPAIGDTYIHRCRLPALWKTFPACKWTMSPLRQEAAQHRARTTRLKKNSFFPEAVRRIKLCYTPELTNWTFDLKLHWIVLLCC